MSETSTVICEYENDWRIIKTETGLIIQEFKESNTPDNLVPVIEVYRFEPSEYEDKDVAELEQIVNEKGITFDVCGELDDCSGYVFWAYKPKHSDRF